MSLDRYVQRRFDLSGTFAVKDVFPYCTPLDDLGVARPGCDASHSLSFAHYDYLGLFNDPRIRNAAKDAIDQCGVGAGASRLVGGELSLHRKLERRLANLIGTDDALTMVSGYGTSVSLLGHLLAKDDLILVDESCHNSVMVGSQSSRATTLKYHHNDLDHLDELLAAYRGSMRRALIVVEGLYSMDGDIPDLPRLIEIGRRHDAWVAIDEAHSIGVLGKTGAGLTEHFGIPACEVDMIVGTLSKAFVSCGGFIAAKQGVIDWLRCTLPGFVYSVGLPPASAAAARTAIEILLAEPDRLVRLKERSEYFLAGAKARGLNTGRAVGAAVIPILFSSTEEALVAANGALRQGYFVPPIVQISVPKEFPRLRFFLTAAHEFSQIDGVLDALPAPAEVPVDHAVADLAVRSARLAQQQQAVV